MARVHLLNIDVLDNPAKFKNPLSFEITFECLEELEDDLEWKLIYVGSAESTEHDQVLDCINVGPVPVGVNKFVFQTDGPRTELLPPSENTVEVTVILLTCSYLAHEELRENPPSPPRYDLVTRSILADKPRVTRFPIAWTRVEPELELPDVDPNVDLEDIDEALDLPKSDPMDLDDVEMGTENLEPKLSWADEMDLMDELKNQEISV